MKRSEKYYTKTMARVYEDQGHFEKAREIYQFLAQGDGISPESHGGPMEKVSFEIDSKERLQNLMERWVGLVFLKKRIQLFRGKGKKV